MSGASWSGRRVARLVRAVIFIKGDTCHLCDLPGADSADHDPPRSELVRQGVPNPDAMVYLHPAHRIPCNVGRGTRPITPALKAELRAKRLAFVRGDAAPASLSPRFLNAAPSRRKDSFRPSPGSPTKTDLT